MRKPVLYVDCVTECMAPIVGGKVRAGEHGAHHVGEGAVGSLGNGVLEGGTGASGLKRVACLVDASAECRALR